ncbi:hypothetical protein Cni_G11201 [Canna indica]|uniref:DUF642 domain-containing protein n=1 Tax=Canna indica TaxID=4628 RepID=A0AAQ3K5M9_9LILI|nr:hypothetical protein Cni_G11201 [Canna indica]
MYSSATPKTALLQNGGFESPPSNIKLNSSNPLSKNNTMPGWSFNGTVYYVSAGPNLSLPDNGHAVQLGVNGTISQTFKLTSMASQYILMFSLAPISKNCTALTALKVSLQSEEITVFVFEGKYGRRSWETHACDLGSWGGEGDHLVLELQSQVMENDPKVLCGPVVDTVILKRFDGTNGYGM